ncbi:MAG TPA: hypothetical protein VE567_09345 [Sphingomonas sp.]|nr:hypothetical protein [Sphingomonas sp.]
MQNQGGGGQTGTRDVTYNLTTVLYHALQGVENCRTYEQDAQGDQQYARFFQQAGQMQQQLAEEAKRLLHDCLMRETQGGQGGSGSAFSFGQQGSSNIGQQSETGSTGMGSASGQQTSGGTGGPSGY